MENRETIINRLKACNYAMEYAAFNYDGSKLENLEPGIIESTGVSESLLIEVRNNNSFIDELTQIVGEIAQNLEQFNQECNKDPKEFWGVHKNHCCAKCGCKYGDKDCPVVLGLVEQKYECQDCKEEWAQVVEEEFNKKIDFSSPEMREKIRELNKKQQEILDRKKRY